MEILKIYVYLNMENKTKAVEAQGVKTEKKKVQRVSKSYALKALMSHVVTLVREGLMSQEDGEAIQDMWKKAAEKYTMELMGKMKVK